MSTTEDEHLVQTLSPDGADEAFGKRIGTRRPDRSTNNSEALSTEDLIEAGGELGVSVTDQKLDRARTLGEFIGKIPGLLHDPGASRICRDSRHEDFSESSSMKKTRRASAEAPCPQ
jgi:hypothetical protein